MYRFLLKSGSGRPFPGRFRFATLSQKVPRTIVQAEYSGSSNTPKLSGVNEAIALMKRKDYNGVLNLMERLKQQNKLRKSHSNFILSAYCGLNKMDDIDHTLSTMKNNNVIIHSNTYQDLFKHYFNTQKFSELSQLLEEMKQNSVPLSEKAVYEFLLTKSCDEVLQAKDLLLNHGYKMISVHTLLANLISEKGKVQDLDNLLTELKRCNIAPDLIFYSSLMKAYARAHKWDSVLETYNQMKSEGIKPDAIAFKPVILCLEKAKETATLRVIRNEMNAVSIDIDLHDLLLMLKTFSAVGAIEDIRELETQIINSHADVPERFYRYLLYGYRDSKEDIDRVLQTMNHLGEAKITEILQKMLLHFISQGEQQKGVELIGRAYNQKLISYEFIVTQSPIVLASLPDFRNPSKLFSTLKDSDFKLSESNYAILMQEIANTKKISFLYEIVERMKKDKIENAVDVFSPIISTLGEMKETKTLQWLEEAIRHHFVPNNQLDEATFGRFIAAYGEAGYIKKSYDLFKEALQSGSSGSTVYSNAIFALGKLNFAQSLEILNEMKQNNIPIDEKSYSSIVNSAIVNKKFDEALQIFEEMKANKIQPSIQVYIGIANVYSSRLDLPSLQALQEELEGTALGRNINWYNNLIRIHCRHGMIELANQVMEKIKHDMLEPTVASYSPIIMYYASRGRLEHCDRLLNSMLDKKIHPDAATYASIIIWLLKEEKLEAALDIFNSMKKQGQTPNSYVYARLISVLSKTGQVEEAEKLINEMKAKGLSTGKSLYSRAGTYYVSSGPWQEWQDNPESALASINNIKKDGVIPPTTLYRTVVEFLVRKSLFDEANQLIKEVEGYYGVVDQEILQTLPRAVVSCEKADVWLQQLLDSDRINHVSTPLIAAILAALIDDGQHQKMQNILRFLQTKNPSMLPLLIPKCVQVLCEAGNPTEAMNLFSTFKDAASHPDNCVEVMASLNNSGHFAQALAVFEELYKSKAWSGGVGYSEALLSVIGLHQPDTLDQFINRMHAEGVLEDINTYNQLLRALETNGYPTLTLHQFEKMNMYNIKPNIQSYGIMIQYCLKSNMSCIDKFVGMLCKETPDPKDLLSLVSIVTNLCENHQAEKAQMVVDHILSHKLPLDQTAYESLIKAFSFAKKVDTAFDILKQMKKAGIRSRTTVYNTILSGMYGNDGRQHMILHRMKKDGLKPDRYTYNIMMNNYRKVDDVKNTKHMLQKMIDEGIRPDTCSYNILLGGLAKAKEFHAAETLYETLKKDPKVKPDIETYTTMLNMFAKLDDVSSVVSVYNNLREDPSVKAQLDQYKLVLSCLSGMGDRRKQLFSIYNDMKDAGIPVDVELIRTLLKGAAHQKDADLTNHWLEQMYMAGIRPNVSIFRQLLKCCKAASKNSKDRSKTDLVLNYAQMYLNSDVKWSEGVYNDLKEALSDEQLKEFENENRELIEKKKQTSA